MLQIVLRQKLNSFSALCALWWSRGGALLPTHAVPGVLQGTRQFHPAGMGRGGLRQRLGALLQAAEEHGTLFLSLNIRSMTLVMSSKEAEPQPVTARSPRAGAGRDWRAALAPQGMEREPNPPPEPKLLAKRWGSGHARWAAKVTPLILMPRLVLIQNV